MGAPHHSQEELARPTSHFSNELASQNDIDQWIASVYECQHLDELKFRKLCSLVKSILMEEPNVVRVKSPVVVCGDVHGQFYDLRELFETGGRMPATNYIFMGDFVDRGYYSIETLTLLLCLKARWPDKITLLRGNHESRQVTSVYGFYDECLTKYGNAAVWKLCCQIFDNLSLAALIDQSIICVHGGLSPEISTIDEIAEIDRNCEIPHKGPFCDMVWSDPEEIKRWKVSSRGAGWLFGELPVRMFLEINSLSLICRAHQLAQDGYKYMFDQKLITVWSAPNYCYRCGNVASVLEISEGGERVIKTFSAVPDDKRKIPENAASLSRIANPFFI